MVATIGIVGGLASAAGSIGGLVNGGSRGSGSNSPYQYVPTGLKQADSNLQSLFQQGQNAAAPIQGLNQQYGQFSQGIINNPYASQAQTNVNDLANQYGGKGWADLANANMLYNQGAATTTGMNAQANQLKGLSGLAQAPAAYATPIWQAGQANQTRQNALGDSTAAAGQSVWNTALDPQNALYNRTQQQLVDQQNAQLAMSGLSGSPYGAGIANQGLSNFNIDWQGNQLKRQLSGLSGLQGANSAAGGLYTSGLQGLESAGTTAGALDSEALSNSRGLATDISNIYSNSTSNLGRTLAGWSDLTSQGLGKLQSGATMPYDFYNTTQNTNIGALNSQAQGALNAFAPTQQIITDQQNYLNTGMNAGQNAQSTNFDQQQIQGKNLGTSLGSLGSLSNGLSSLFGPQPIQASDPYSGISSPGNGAYLLGNVQDVPFYNP